MSNILKKYSKTGVITTGDDNLELDSPSIEIVSVYIDTLARELTVEVMHEVMQGSLTRKHSRSFKVSFDTLPSNIKMEGKGFLDAIETAILALPQYVGSVEG